MSLDAAFKSFPWLIRTGPIISASSMLKGSSSYRSLKISGPSELAIFVKQKTYSIGGIFACYTSFYEKSVWPFYEFFNGFLLLLERSLFYYAVDVVMRLKILLILLFILV